MITNTRNFSSKIITKEIKTSTLKNRAFNSNETNEENLLVRDELKGIFKNGNGYCFTMSQLEMIVTALKQKLSNIEFNTLKIIKDDFCFTITVSINRKKKKQEKNSLATV